MIPYQRLEITDGSTTVDLLSPKSGFYLRSWNPILSEPKAGGVWRDSQLADGRKLSFRKRANAVDSLALEIRDWTPDDLIRDTQNLRRLLEKACSYRTTRWQDEPVYVVRQGTYESAPTYSLIEDYRTPQDGNPHGSDTFWNRVGTKVSFPVFNLVLEHEPWWRAYPPGQGVCVQARGMQAEWDYEDWTLNTAQPGWIVRDIMEASCGNMLACESSEVWRTNTGGAVWTASTTPPGTLFEGMKLYEDTSDGDIFLPGYTVAMAGEFWRSQDCGVNWTRMSATIGTDQPNSLCKLSTYLYLCTGNSGALAIGGTIRRSNDDGATWTEVHRTLAGTPATRAILADSTDTFMVASQDWSLAGGKSPCEIVRSTDGTAWTVVWHEEYGGQIYCITELADGYFYALGRRGVVPFATGRYILRSSDGIHWGQISELEGTTAFHDMILADDGYYYLADGENGEIWRSSDAISWAFVTDIGAVVASLHQYSGNDRIYAGETGDIFYSPTASATVGRDETCNDEVYVTNKNKVAQLTHIWTLDASGPTWVAQFPHTPPFPFPIFPATMANNDAIYFGIDQTLVNAGPFDNLVFDIGTSAAGQYALTWQYSDGVAGWPTLPVTDNTNRFTIQGVNSVHWVPPDAAAPGGLWTPEAVNGETCLWIRAVISSVTGSPVGPTQANRDVYTCNWPHTDVDSAQVLGDIPALAQIKFHNRSDDDGYVQQTELDLLDNRAVVGLRSMSRGELPSMFCAYLNCADEQNPFGVSVAVGAASAFADDITAPAGRVVAHTTTGTSTWADEVVFTLSPRVARDYYGSHHLYLRAYEVDRSAAMDEVRVRVQVRTGTGGVTYTTKHKPFRNLNDWQLLDFGGVDVPVSGLLSSDDLGDESEIAVQVWSSVASLTVKLYDLILIPVDEWAGDFVDKALEDDSGVCRGYLLDVDSVTYPKRDVRSLVRRADVVGYVRSIYEAGTPGPATLQSNANQRLWFLTARGCVTGTCTAGDGATLTDANASFLTSGVESGQVIFNVTDGSTGTVGATVTATTISDCGLAGGTDNDWDTNDEYLIICPNWRSEPWNCHSVQLWCNPRYLSMKGAR